MASETIYGCVNWTNGVITYTQDDCRYNGCVQWSGEHAGMIQIKVDTETCDDTYYGCIDWSTGKFEVTVPDDCCDENPDSPNCPCPLCSSYGKQPMSLYLNLSPGQPCSQFCSYRDPDFGGGWDTVSGCLSGFYHLRHNGECFYSSEHDWSGSVNYVNSDGDVTNTVTYTKINITSHESCCPSQGSTRLYLWSGSYWVPSLEGFNWGRAPIGEGCLNYKLTPQGDGDICLGDGGRFMYTIGESTLTPGDMFWSCT